MKVKIFSLGMLKMFSIVASVTLGSVAARGAVLIETVNVTPSSSGISSTITFNIPQFDPSLGTLNGVDLILTPTFGDFGSAAFNLSSSPQQVLGFTVGAPMSGSLGGALGLNASWTTSQNLTSPNYTASAGPSVITDGPPLPFTFVTTLSSVVVGPGGFTGLGGYNLVLSGSGRSNFIGKWT